nr:hypothetical protein [Tanacetum cinerariifolium]
REEKRIEEEQAAKAQCWKFPVCYDDDGDEESSNPLEDNIISELPSYSAVTPTEPIDSLNPHSFNAESDLIGSMPNHDSSIIISSKIGSLLDEFDGELTLLKSFPPGIDKTDCHPKKDIRLAKSDPLMEEINLYFNPDYPMPSGIEDDDDDSERDVPILEEWLDNYSLSLPANESYHFDIPSPYRPPAKPPDGNTGTLNIKMLGNVSDQKGAWWLLGSSGKGAGKSWEWWSWAGKWEVGCKRVWREKLVGMNIGPFKTGGKMTG